MNHRMPGRLTALGIALGMLSCFAVPSLAQTTVVGLQAVPNKTTLQVGETLTINLILNVNSLATGDSYTAIRSFFYYAAGSAGNGTPASLFTATPTVANFPGTAPANSGFANSTLSNPDVTATSDQTYRGWSIGLNNGVTPRTDTGTFKLANFSAVLRPDLAPGQYTLGFKDISGLGRTFLTGTFGGVSSSLTPDTTPSLGTNTVIITVTPVPAPASWAVLLLGGGLCGGYLCHSRRRNSLSAA